MLQGIPGLQDAFCGTETVLHMKKGSDPLDPEVAMKVLDESGVECEGIDEDESLLL